MKLSNHSIGARMATALGLVLALLLGAALFGIATLYRTLGTYDSTVLQRVAQERAVSRMESEFKTQVLEWKNTLLRGEDSRKRELHWAAFQASEKRVADAARALEPQLSDANERAALQKFTDAHAQMAQGYRKGFEVFQSLGFVPAAGDADVADIDQGPAKLLTALSEQVAASSAAIAQAAAQDARNALVSTSIEDAVSSRLAAVCSVRWLRSWLPLAISELAVEMLPAASCTWRTRSRNESCMRPMADTSWPTSSWFMAATSRDRSPLAMRSASSCAWPRDLVMERTLKNVRGISTASPSTSPIPISADMVDVRDSTPARASSI